MKNFTRRCFVVIILFVVLSRSEVIADTCNRNETNYVKMCSDAAFVGKEFSLDTDLFLNTNYHFCFCEISATDALSLIPATSDSSNCGPLISVKLSATVTLKQFTCKLSDPLNVTVTNDSTIYIELKGIGTLRTCISITSENDFDVTCYSGGIVPPALTTGRPPSLTSTNAPTTPSPVTSQPASQSSISTSANTTSSDNGTSLTAVVTGWQTTSLMPLTSDEIQESFVLILTACVLGFLTLVAVVVLLICKFARHVRSNRESEREDTSYDITMRPTVEKLSARKLDDNELVSMDNCLYEETENGISRVGVSHNAVLGNLNHSTADGERPRSTQTPNRLIYADLDHVECRSAGKRASKSDKVEYSVVQLNKV